MALPSFWSQITEGSIHINRKGDKAVIRSDKPIFTKQAMSPKRAQPIKRIQNDLKNKV